MLILFSVCLIASPETCREERISFSFEGVSSTLCLAHSQEAIAQWQSQHPLWRVARWHCVARAQAPTQI